MTGTHVYRAPLAERTIRLLTVEHDDPGSPLHCTLQETCLDTGPVPYYALSYCWGAAQPPVSITCNSYPISVTPNLYSALHEYRRRTIRLPLWVDAICINQADISERTAQVRMMKDIYSKGARVVIWLGGAEPTDGHALELLKAMNAPWATFRDPTSGRLIPLFTIQNAAHHDALVAAQTPEVYFDALAAFLMRPWFSRIWIVQEVLCAGDLIIWCGERTLNEEFPLLEACGRLIELPNCNTKTQFATTVLADKEAQAAGRLKLMCAGRLWALKILTEKKAIGIYWAILISRSFEATDPRDKIFALVGLASDVEEEFVDYSKSYEEIVEELSRMLLDGRIKATSGSALDIWSSITRGEAEELAEPTWVVDWVRLKSSLYTPLMSEYASERPLIQLRPDVQFSKTEDDEETLHVRGTIFDTVTHIVPSPVSMRSIVPQSSLVISENVSDLLEWHAQASGLVVNLLNTGETAYYRPTGESLHDAFWRTLCCNRFSLNLSQAPVDDSSYTAWRSLLGLQQARHYVEMSYRRRVKLQKWALWGITTASITALTYHFRRNKLLICAVPFALPPLVRFIHDGWDLHLRIYISELFQEFLQRGTQLQIDQRDFEQSHSQWTQGRQFGVTQQGLIGWIPLAAKVGDHLGMFAGCRIPYLLRASGNGFKVVGDAYVHGVMEGEGEVAKYEMLRIM